MANDKFKATPVVAKNTTVPNEAPTELISSVEFLPKYHQTSTNKKFFNVTLDPLISKGSAEDINAYIGRKSGTVFNPAQDPYVVETRAAREDYQLDTGIVSTDADGNIVKSLAYADLLQKYKDQYSKFTPANLDANYYSWSPNIDVDKFVNFGQYYWLPQGLPAIELTGDIDIAAFVLGKAAYSANGVKLHNGMKLFFTNNTIADAKYITRPDAERTFVALTHGPLMDVSNLIGQDYALQVDCTYTTTEEFYGPHTVLKNVFVPELQKDTAGNVVHRNWFEVSPGVIELSLDGALANVDVNSLNVRVKVINRPVYFTVAGIGSSIELLSAEVTNPQVSYVLNIPEGWDTVSYDMSSWDATHAGLILAEYIVMQRGSRNKNAWSRVNQWHHIDAIESTFAILGQEFKLAALSISRAKRPIIEFTAGMELMNHGETGLGYVDLVANNSNIADIASHVTATIDGVELQNKHRILLINNSNLSDNNRIATVSGVGSSIVLTFDNAPVAGDTVLVRNGTAYASVELWFNGTDWVAAQQKTKRNQFPMFVLYDYLGNRLDDTTVYKNSNFTGSTVFQYKAGTFSDTELGFNVEYEDTSYDILSNASPYAKNFANLKFNWTQNTPNLFYEKAGSKAAISGNYYTKVNGVLSNGWVRNSEESLTFQRISKVVDLTTNNTLSVPADVLPSYEYQAFLHNGQLRFNIVSKDGSIKLWDPVNGHLVFPVGYGAKATIHNFTGQPFTIRNKTNQLAAGVTNNGTTLTIETALDATNVDGEYMYYECAGTSHIVQLVNPFKDARSLQVRLNGNKLDRTAYTISVNADKTYAVEITTLAKNDIIELMFVSNTAAGAYATHNTVEANADNASIYETSFSKMFEHFVSTISAQPTVTGPSYGANTYYDSSKNTGLGYVIQQHNHSSLLPGLLLAGNIDPYIVMSKAGQSFASYRTKFISKLQQVNQSLDTSNMLPSELVDNVLGQLNVGKNSTFPYANSGMVLWNNKLEYSYIGNSATTTFKHNANVITGNLFNDHVYVYVNGVLVDNVVNIGETDVVFAAAPATDAAIVIKVYAGSQGSYVPPSLAKLGITAMRFPQHYVDNTRGARSYILCHDGAEVTSFDDAYVDRAILEFERRVFFGAAHTTLDARVNEPGYYRKSAATLADKNIFLQQFYTTWASDNSITLMDNVGYDAGNPFTWNYTSSVNTVGGSWRAIYSYLFDTEAPHSRPWEMLGYGVEPQWWSTNYSWTDAVKRVNLEAALRSGTISEPGTPVTMRTEFARPYAVFPVCTAGELLDPIAAGICALPGADAAAMPWAFGDYGNQESAWRRSAGYQWAVAIWNYVIAPNTFLGNNFDTFDSIVAADNSQIVSKEFGRRKSVSEIVLHRQGNVNKSGINQLVTDYIIAQNKNLETDYYNVINNGQVQLMFKVGGYADKRTLRFKADTLKQVGGSNFIPEENFSIHFYKGAAFNSAFYSGVKVIWTGSGYELQGYDKVNSYFTVYLPRKGARSKASTFNNVDILDVYDFATTTTVIPYGTVMTSRQDVYNFFTGLNKVMIERGFVFDQFDSNQDGILDFKLSGKQFMFWSDSKWAVGSFIALSPVSDLLKFSHSYGTVDDYNAIVDYDPVVNESANKIALSDLDFDRTQDGMFTLTSKLVGQGIFGLAIDLVEVEHAVVFDNTTTFGDTVYNPLYRLKQYRLKYVGQRTRDWNGTTYSPGFLLNGDKIIGNFDRTIADISDRYYAVEGSTQNSRLTETARHSIGVENTGAIANLIDNQNTLFEFTKSVIRQKGTPAAFSKILRSAATEGTLDKILADEEWMFKLGEFGNINSINSWEFKLKQADFKEVKQLIRFDASYTFNPTDLSYTKNLDSPLDRVIDMPSDDVRWIYKPVNKDAFTFATRELTHTINNVVYETVYSTDTVNAGYAARGDADLAEDSIDNLKDLYTSLTDLTDVPQWTAGAVYKLDDLVRYEGKVYSYGGLIVNTISFDLTQWTEVGEQTNYRVWVADYTSAVDSNNANRFTNQKVPLGWNMLGVQDTSLAIKTITADAISPTAPVTVTFLTPHTLQQGDVIVVVNADSINGIHTVLSATSESVTIDAVTSTVITTGKVLPMLPTRFATVEDLQTALTSTRYNWKSGQLAYVDNVAGRFTVYEITVTGTGVVANVSATQYATEQALTDPGLIRAITVYDRTTNRELVELDIYDPFKGFIPTPASVNIDIRSSNDPAAYSVTTNSEIDVADMSAWSDDQVGTVWWDLSTSKFMNYEQGSLEYRYTNWGRLFPGASIDVYQWISSTVDPVAYNKASASATPIGDVVPVGTAKVTIIDQETLYSYSTKETVNADGTLTTVYYFWVKGIDTVSLARPDKTLSIASIAAIIQHPGDMGIAWAAPIAKNALIVSGASKFLNNDSTTLQMQFADYADNNMGLKPEVHSQWMLLRENDSVMAVPQWLHNRLRDSLAGFDRNTQTLTWAGYDNERLYTAGEVFYRIDDSTFYRVFRTMNSNDITVSFAQRPFYQLYDYTLLPPNATGTNIIKIQSRRDVPNYRLDEYNRYGNQIRPVQQTWIKDRNSARRTFIASANKLIAQMDLFETVPNWNKHLTAITKGTHSYDITKFYNVIDFVSATFNSFKPVVQTYALETDIDMNVVNEGDYVLVQNQSRYAIYQITSNQRVLMYKKNATIEFTEDLFNSIKQQFSWDLAPWDFAAWDNEPGVEFGEIVTAMREDIFVGDYSINYNRLFFDMVRYIFSENDAVDWIAKSSYLYIDNLDVDNLEQKPYFIKDKVQQYIDYINEVKPYRTKVRQVIDTRTAMDTAVVEVTDFVSPEIEMLYARHQSEDDQAKNISGGRFGVVNANSISGGRFGDSDNGAEELVKTTVTDFASIEVVTKYGTAVYSFRISIDSDGAQVFNSIGHTGAELPLPLNTNLMFNDLGKTLQQSANSGAMLILQEPSI